MGLIKTPIRSTMSHDCLNHCMIFSTHKEEVDKLNLKKLATDFVLDVPKCKNSINKERFSDWLKFVFANNFGIPGRRPGISKFCLARFKS
jgi:hypothetical protein